MTRHTHTVSIRCARAVNPENISVCVDTYNAHRALHRCHHFVTPSSFRRLGDVLAYCDTEVDIYTAEIRIYYRAGRERK